MENLGFAGLKYERIVWLLQQELTKPFPTIFRWINIYWKSCIRMIVAWRWNAKSLHVCYAFDKGQDVINSREQQKNSLFFCFSSNRKHIPSLLEVHILNPQKTCCFQTIFSLLFIFISQRPFANGNKLKSLKTKTLSNNNWNCKL